MEYASGLRNTQTLGAQDPYVILKCGSQTFTGDVVTSEHCNQHDALLLLKTSKAGMALEWQADHGAMAVPYLSDVDLFTCLAASVRTPKQRLRFSMCSQSEGALHIGTRKVCSPLLPMGILLHDLLSMLLLQSMHRSCSLWQACLAGELGLMNGVGMSPNPSPCVAF